MEGKEEGNVGMGRDDGGGRVTIGIYISMVMAVIYDWDGDV